MDTSKVYINMSDHSKIQEQWKQLDGDYFYGEGWWGHPTVMMLFDANSCCAVLPRLEDHKDTIWLPRQDQIQKMIGNFEKCVDIITNLEDETGFFTAYTGFPPTKFIRFSELPRFGSMEKLWLCIYMYGKHKLVWDGKKWQKE